MDSHFRGNDRRGGGMTKRSVGMTEGGGGMTKRSAGMTIFRNDNIPPIFLNKFILKCFK